MPLFENSYVESAEGLTIFSKILEGFENASKRKIKRGNRAQFSMLVRLLRYKKAFERLLKGSINISYLLLDNRQLHLGSKV